MPGPILDVANRLLPFTEVVERAEPQRAARRRAAGRARRRRRADLFDAVAAEVVAVRHRHHNTGVVAPLRCTRRSATRWPTHGLRRGRSRPRLAYDDVPVFTAEAVKGLEFDGVVVVNAHQIFDGIGARGAPALRGDDPCRAGAAPRRRCPAAAGTGAVRAQSLHLRVEVGRLDSLSGETSTDVVLLVGVSRVSEASNAPVSGEGLRWSQTCFQRSQTTVFVANAYVDHAVPRMLCAPGFPLWSAAHTYDTLGVLL